MQLLGGFGADLGEVRQAEIAGGQEVRGEFGGDDFVAGGPDGEHGGLFGEVPPLLDDVVDVELRRVFELRDGGGGGAGDPFAIGAGSDVAFRVNGDAQGSIADDERGVGVGIGFEKFGGDLPAAGGEDFDEGLGGAGAAVERNAAGLADGHFADEQEAAHALLGGDGQAGEDGEADALAHDALVLDGGNDGDVGGAGAEGFSAFRGDGEGEVVFAMQRAVGEAADERGGVEILHDGDAEFAHVGCAKPETQV